MRTGSSHIGSTRAVDPERRGQRGVRLRRGLPVGQAPRALQAPREVAVAEREPRVRRAEVAQRVHDVERVAVEAPAALVDRVGEPEAHEVGVGRDGRAVDLDVVAGVDDDDEVVADEVEHAARELGAAGPAGEDDDRPGHQTPVMRMPACVLCLMFIEIRSAVSDSVIRECSRRPASSGAQPVDPRDQRDRRLLGVLAVPADQDVLAELVLEVGERRGADGVQRADDVDAVGDELGGLLGGRALPDADHARRLAADGGRQRHGRVDDERAGLQALGDRLVGRGRAGERAPT